MNIHSRKLPLLAAALLATSAAATAQNTSQLAQNGWFSDDTRADGTGTQPAGTNLISPFLTDDPEATASGASAHDADILSQITFGAAPGTVPAGTHRGAVHLQIAAGSGSGKSQVSHRKDDGTGFATGADAFGSGMSMTYSWMGDGTSSVTASIKFGVKTADFGSTGASGRTGENVWDKVMIYEPGNLNGGTSNGTWQTETVDFTTGKWWFFDRTEIAGTIGTPMTLSDMSTSGTVFSGSKTIADVYALVTAPGAHITSVQVGIGSGNAGGSIYVNELTTSFYRAGSTTTFGTAPLEFDQNVTSDVIFGSGNINGEFTTDRHAGVEIGLRGKLRFDSGGSPANIFNSNGDGTYTFEPGAAVGGAGWVTPDTPVWNFEWSVNTDYDASSGDLLDDLTYELGMDFDPGPGTNYLVFDPITPSVMVPYWDHAIGTNATPNGGGTTAGSGPAYVALLAANNLAQNSWNMEFFNDPPFDIFDPNVEGRYEFYLAASSGGTEVARSHITIVVESQLEYDQNVTNEAIFGSGNANGDFVVDRNAGVELGLRTKQRFGPPPTVYNSNGDGTYTWEAIAATSGAGWITPMTPIWNFEWSVNTDYDGSSGLLLDDLTYEIGIDFDPSSATNFLSFDLMEAGVMIPYTPAVVQTFWDHSIGTNATANGAGVEATNVTEYLSLIAANNLAQNSWNVEFFNEFPFDIFDPTVPGRYEYYLSASNGTTELARTEMTVLTYNGASLSVEADDCQSDQDLGKAGVQIEVELWMRNLGTDVTGFQAFLEFDDSKLTYEGAESSYSATPFGTHFQPVATAEVSPGESRLDGNGGFPSPASTSDDSLLATLVFTVATECDPVTVDFDVAQPFPSELSFEGSPIATSLVDSPSIVPDATPPILTVPADITVAADAGVGGGCTSAAVSFTPTAVDSCGSVSIVSTPASGSDFPAGATTTVTVVATDDCGNTTADTFDVTVTLTNVVDLDIQLVGVTTAGSRCIELTTNACGSSTDLTLPFDGTGLFSGEIEVPCGAWTLICAKDEQHTKWDTASLMLSIDGTKYEATATLSLDGGDTDNDGDVDINDVTQFLLQFGTLAAPGGCPWDGVTRDADFSNNGAIGSEDYVFLTANWLTLSSCTCALVPSGHLGRPDRLSSLRVTAENLAADLTQDGRIDWRDVELLELSYGLSGELSRKMRAEHDPHQGARHRTGRVR